MELFSPQMRTFIGGVFEMFKTPKDLTGLETNDVCSVSYRAADEGEGQTGDEGQLFP